MREIEGKVEGNVTIDEDTILKGIITGNVTVTRDAEFALRGIVNGNITIFESSAVYLRGVVNGDVINNGGSLEVYGIINGRLFRERGETFIDDDAIIQSK